MSGFAITILAVLTPSEGPGILVLKPTRQVAAASIRAVRVRVVLPKRFSVASITNTDEVMPHEFHERVLAGTTWV